GRAVQDHQFGLRRDGRSQLFGGDFELLRLVGFYNNRLAFRNQDHVGIGNPIGSGNNDFVAGVDNSQRQVEKALLAPTGYQDRIGLVGEVIVTAVLCDNCLLESSSAIHGGVLGLAATNSCNSRFFDVFWGIEVGLSCAQADNIP